jgi:hypothetical protein
MALGQFYFQCPLLSLNTNQNWINSARPARPKMSQRLQSRAHNNDRKILIKHNSNRRSWQKPNAIGCEVVDTGTTVFSQSGRHEANYQSLINQGLTWFNILIGIN